MATTKRKTIQLSNNTRLEYYYARDDHGSHAENYTHRDNATNKIIKVYCQTFRAKPKSLIDLLKLAKE